MIRRQDLGDGVVLLAFACPGPVNTLGAAFNRDFAACIEALLADAAVNGIVLGSDKRDFVAGGDLGELRRVATPADAIAIVTPFNAVLRRIETGGKPVVAALNGSALGGGLELALACHHRIAAEVAAARFGLPEVTLGLMPGAGGTQRLPRLIGLAAAAPLLLDGKPLRLADAVKAGLVDGVVAPEALLETAKAWVLAHPGAVQPWDVKGFRMPGFAVQSAEGRQFLMAAWAQLHRRSAGTDLAGEAILQVLLHGLERSLEPAIAIETRHFARLAASPDAKAKIRTLFVGVNDARAMKTRPAGVPATAPARLAVIGGGVMGRGIAYAAAIAGLAVDLLDVSPEATARSIDEIARLAGRDAERGRLRGAADEVVGRIRASADYAGLAAADVVVEAVFERAEIKRDVLGRVAAVVRPDVPIASNTSTIPITSLAGAVPAPDRVLGLHFFSPVERMQLVEVIRTERTSDLTLATALDLLRRMDKAPVVVKDGLGFFTSRIVTTYSSETFNLLAEGVPPQLIDNAAIGAGFAIGPAALADLTTLPLLADIFASMRGDGDRPANRGNVADAALAKVVAAGRRGKVAGDGLYSYDASERRPWDGLAACLGVTPSLPPVESVRERLLTVQSVEAVRCLEDGVLARPIDGDVAAVLGWGYPAHLGGVFSYIDRIGAAAFVRRCEVLAARHGGRFAPPGLLVDMARSGGRFHEL